MQYNNYSNVIPDLIYFVNRKCAPSWSIIKGEIKFHDLTYVYKGRSTYLINGVEYNLSQGDFIYVPIGNVRQAYTDADEPMQCFAANFLLSDAATRSEGITLPWEPVIKTGVSAELISLYSELDHIWVEQSFNYKMRARAVFMLILDKIMCRIASGIPMQQEDPRLLKIKQYILHNFMDRIEISKLADIVGLNPVYLGAFFKKANGCTIKQYITRIRINNAESLLSTGGYTVSEAAARSGFDDLFYFSKVYRAYKGYAPSVLLKGRGL
ncbi:MAG: AraC family transcriptional regulator [Clostridiaceae bacterium]|jgi:AraC-like DNA-binding protein|nr:AraC family transcriptional regulator [Clostridiaceae bacterium]